jgi:hypothetical protein
MSPVLLDFNLSWLATRIPEGAYLLENMFLLLLIIRFFKIIWGIFRQCLVYGHKLDRQKL